ncbi:MAG: acyl-CoA dehydrogenase [Candidatus Marinimicrobia bacterium]|jgi:alkylation response protein AidB-like acyl-CoA dehydrogenase|nr:acyl-CoA dehydrogenase family protein [Gammaproteobacteria bacterium]MBL6911884.1 acyl-CoA dehydrogenase family protein [Candidatus Neomarinimicrobiota bacterium]MBT3727824.1 acyl-CoA dehydrogenase [Candidatus Neomarinimicrobiota bacterium]MBT3943927.1 acyl-CoA dehydrogenase [Candidatus Neomarinimicrobiota bacterium]MBT4111576.1 acyl-CoA dehydrogenase [Candidatus Neomarinimicrobiota bacterium]
MSDKQQNDNTNNSSKDGAIDFSKIKTGGKFLTTVVGTNKVFCKEAFSEEERMIYDAMSDFATNELLPLSKNELNKKDEKLIRKLVEQMGELGFLGVDVPEKYGGSEMTKTGMCILAEGISKSGSASFCTVWNVQTSIGSLGIIWYGNDEQKQRWLPGISSGEKITAFGLTEPEAGSDATNSKTTGVLSDDGKHYILNGQKIFISNGAWADLFTIALKIDGKFSSIVVEKGTPGFEIGKEEKKMGMEGSSTVPLYFTDCKVPVENLLGKVGEGAGPAFCALNIGRFKLGASSIGGMMLGIQQAVDYAKQRKAFGQYISDFGSIQEKLATCTVLAYTTDSMCYAVIGNQTDAISELDKDDPEYYIKQGNITERYIAENSIVKIYGSESSGELIDHCLQVFGGYGFIEEYPMAQAYRDARINRIWEGTNEINKMLCGRSMITKTLSGELGFREYLEKVNGYCNEGLDSGYEGDYKDEVECIEAAKAVYALALNESLSRYGQDIGTEQVIIENLANILIYCYVSDSTVSRVMQNKDFYDSKGEVVPELCAKVYTAEQGIRVMEYANKIFNSIFDSEIPADIEQKLDVLKKRLSLKTDTIGLKKIIGEKVVEAGGYPVKSF